MDTETTNERSVEATEAAQYAPPFTEVEAVRSVLRFIALDGNCYAKSSEIRAEEIAECLVDRRFTAPNALKELTNSVRYSAEARLRLLSNLTPEQGERLTRAALMRHGSEERHLSLTGSYPDALTTLPR